MLTDEGSSVVDFLDDCVQRCLKTPYRYLEEKDALARSVLQNVTEDEGHRVLSDHHEVLCSPVLITVLDQLGAKIANNLLTPSDVLAITTFIRKLVFNLSSKQHNLVFLSAIIDRVDVLVHPGLFPQYPTIMTAIRGEMSILRFCLRHMQDPPFPPPPSNNSIVQEFLDRINQVPIRQCPFKRFILYLSNTLHVAASTNARAILAYELTDWVRLTDYMLHPSQLDRLASVIDRFHPPALKEFFQNLSPSQGSVWDIAVVRPKLLRGCVVRNLITSWGLMLA